MKLPGKSTSIALCAVAAVGLAACGSGSSRSAPAQVQLLANPAVSNTPGPSISVAGVGKVDGKPDTATVTIGVETTDPSAQAALQKNNDEATALINELKAKGVAAKDLQTSNLSVNPNWDLKQHITGYTVSNTVTATLHDLAHAGSIIDAAAAKVGNDIRLQGVMFSIDNTSSLIAAARAEAVKDALAQGHQLADAAGVKLGSIRTIDDTGGQAPQPQSFYADAAKRALTSAATTPIEAGSQRLTFNVSVVFDIAS